MKKVYATKAQNNFGELQSQCQLEPISIINNGRPYAVLLSMSDYKRLKEIEAKFYGKLAFVSESCGFMDDEEMNKWIEDKIIASSKTQNQ